MQLDEFELLARNRRATRHFHPEPIPEHLLDRLLEIARWAPSGYNLQPTHMVVVTDAVLKKALHRICLNQAQILEAPAIVIFTGDRRADQHNFQRMLDSELAAGSITSDYASMLRRIIPLSFQQSPLGLNWLWKALLTPFARLFIPMPSIPAVHKRYWVAKQVMLTAMNFMLAASAAGLATVPMEGFDEARIRQLLQIPRSHIIPVIIPIGYAVPNTLIKTRLPIEDLIHRNGW